MRVNVIIINSSFAGTVHLIIDESFYYEQMKFHSYHLLCVMVKSKNETWFINLYSNATFMLLHLIGSKGLLEYGRKPQIGIKGENCDNFNPLPLSVKVSKTSSFRIHCFFFLVCKNYHIGWVEGTVRLILTQNQLVPSHATWMSPQSMKMI